MLNVLLNILLFVFKYTGGKLIRSVSVTSDAFNNLMDAVTTMFAWIGVKVSAVGAGENHPNGHGKFEWIIALLSSGSIILVGWELFKESVNVILDPKETVFSVFTLVVLIISICVKFFMYLYNKNQGLKKDSEAMKAVSVDCLADTVSTTAVLASLIINWVTGLRIDGWCGALVALFIIYNGFKELGEITDKIMGRRASDDDIKKIKEFALRNSCFMDITNILFEDYGNGRIKVSFNAIANEGIETERLLMSAANLKFRIFSEFGYLTNINVEKIIADDEIRRFIEDNLNAVEIPPTIKALRVSNAGGYKLVELELGIEFMNSKKMEEYKSSINEKMENAPDGYKVLTQFLLNRYEHWHRNEIMGRLCSVPKTISRAFRLFIRECGRHLHRSVTEPL
ncbi:cation diffusion facilitator family transporter [Lachnospiraceae bacterium JC7]|nr:cation diffusion facilitator family transporter [Lachnospiraceae bacterium JC7]